jgi:hypothetical protein
MQILPQNQRAINEKLSYGPREDNQPSHYEFEPHDAEKTIKSTTTKIPTSSSGEFEMPVIDEYGLHSAPKAQITPTEEKVTSKNLNAHEKSPDLNSMDSVMKNLMAAANGFGIFATGASAVSRAVNYQASKDKETFFDKLAGFAVKGSMGINSAFNVYNGIRKKSIFDTAGFLGELIIASAAPYKFVNLLRGLTFCLYQTPEFLTSTLVGGELPKSESWGDNWKIMKERLPKAFSQIFKAETYSPKMLKTSSGLITGMWGGILSLLGVGVWGLTGNSEIGGAIKGVGEGLVDLFQVIPKEHWECKKTNYIRSGFSFIAGTSADIASRLMGNEPLLRDVCFFFVGIGRWLMSLSKAAGESNYGPGGVTKPSPTALAA